MIRPAAVCLLMAAMLAAAPPAAAGARPKTPIEHFIVLMQENHSFDNYFGTYPAADGIPAGTCMPAGRGCVRPFRLGGRAIPDLGHDARMHRIAYAGGRMDGFARAAAVDRQREEPSVMGYYDDRDLPYYWNVAREHVLFDRFFAASTGGSVANHMFWVTGTDAGDRIPKEGFGELPTIFDRLDERGISWKFYVEDYDPRLRLSEGGASGSAQAVRVPLLNYSRYVADKRLFTRIVDLEEYYEDLDEGDLPQVAYIAPAGASEHPPGRTDTGAKLVRGLITALARSRAWDRSAFMWTYDNWGGWFDHVRPPRVDRAGYGFRVPALLVSPYARRGHVDSTRLDTTSILKFIEENWSLDPLARRDANANNLSSAFDFSAPPREPAIIAAGRDRTAPPAARRPVIYVGYGAVVILGLALLGWAARSRRALGPVMTVILLLGLAATPARAQPSATGGIPPSIRTVPEVPGMRFSLDGRRFEADREGRARPPLAAGSSSASLRAIDTPIRPGVRARFDRWYRGRRIAAIELLYKVEPSFADPAGYPVDPDVVTSATLQGSNGSRHVLAGGRPRWLQGNRVIPESRGSESTALSYAVEKVVVAGSTVVHRAQQRFLPSESRKPKLQLSFFSVRVSVRDALLGFPIGRAIRLRYPSGQEQRHVLGRRGDLTLRFLPRGDYRITADALGISSPRPVALSRDQRVELRVMSWLDVVVVLLGLGSIALALFFARRGSGRAAVSAALALVACAMFAVPAEATGARPPDRLFAYYYIWFNTGSWDRAKTDYPLLGRYSSDDRAVMRRHVQWAKKAGIDGFIVSWKSTPVLNRRLQRLVEVAAAERFKLLVIYQGLDFHRAPLPTARVAADIDSFERRYGSEQVFDVFGKPAVIWSGTPRFSRAEVARVAGPRRKKLLILASERNVAGYRRVAGLVDGNAYYWGAVNPSTYPGYPEKLADMGRAVHARKGLWIAPAAPGFDARRIGGRGVVERRDGATLREELDAATGSGPDAVGLISWNEFSENTHVEPSRRYGPRALEVVADVRKASPPGLEAYDSSEPAATGVSYGLPLLGGIALFLAGSVVMLVRRGRRNLSLPG